MALGKLKIATCQFAVSGSINRNADRIEGFLRQAKKRKADIVHLPESALSGYAGTDLETLNNLNWQLLKERTEKIMALAGKLGLWVVLGSTHKLTPPNKPHNCLYLIGPDGKISDRYDKRFCTEGDLQHYTQGNRFVIFTVNKVRCALLICFDLRFPEPYRELYKEKVDCVLQSFYNARMEKNTVHKFIMRQTMQCRAATNYFWASCANSSGYYSPWPSCLISPDGIIAHQLRSNRAGMMVNTIDLNREFYDPMKNFRDRAANGALSSSSKKTLDPRSENVNVI